MNKFVKYFVLPFVTFASAVGISAGVTYGLTKKHDKKQLQVEYNKGYQNALTDESFYKEQLDLYKGLISEKNSTITDYSNQIAQLTSQNTQKQAQLTTLQSQLNVVNAELDLLKSENSDYIGQVSDLNNRVQVLESKKLELENEITLLEGQIEDYPLQIQNMQKEIDSLRESVAYYEDYLSSFVGENQVVARFEYDGSVYDIQTLLKGDYVVVENPVSTEYMIFNGWKVNGEFVDLSTYQITENTTFVADITYKYDVKFVVDNEEYNTQVVEKGNYITLPSNPSKEGYIFEGWSLSNSVVSSDIDKIQVSSNMTYYAVFSKLHSVVFMYEDSILSTQTIKNGNLVEYVAVQSTNTKVFNGWLVNNERVDISTYKILSDTTFVADITYKYNVKFMVDDNVYNSQYVVKNDVSTLSTTPTKTNYAFVGWSLDKVSIVDIANVNITSDTTFYAIFEKMIGLSVDGIVVKSWDEMINDGTIVVEDNVSILFDYTDEEVYVDVEGSVIKSVSDDIVGDLEIPDTIVGIDYNAFKDCSLTSVIMPNTITYIGYQSFYNCDSLISVKLSESLIGIGYECFGDCDNLKSIDIPDSVNSIGIRAFSSCNYLTSVKLSSSITEIPERCFSGCWSLSDVVIPDGVIKIGHNAFNGCDLKTIYIPSSVITIKTRPSYESIPFGDCDSLTIYCGATSKPSGYGSCWDKWYHYDQSQYQISVKWGYTYSQYLAEIGK